MSTLTWSETMRGRVSFDTDDYNQGWWHGTPCAFGIDASQGAQKRGERGRPFLRFGPHAPSGLRRGETRLSNLAGSYRLG